MKGLTFDIISMAIVSLLLFLYLGRELEAFLVFVVGLFSLRQIRRLTSEKLQNDDKGSSNNSKEST